MAGPYGGPEIGDEDWQRTWSVNVMAHVWREEDPSSRLASASGETITPAEAADALVRGIAEDRFLILSHPEVRTYMQRKATDPPRWLGGMQRFQAQIDAARAEWAHLFRQGEQTRLAPGM